VAERRWFKDNLGEVEALEHEQAGLAYLFGERMPRELFRDFGINVRVLAPGQPSAIYHSEAVEELFLVLGGECLAVVEDEEVPLRKWDFLHCPPGTAHVIVGAGDGPAHVLMVGGRRAEAPPRYPVSDVAARYGASVRTPADSPQEAWRQLGWELSFGGAPLPWPPD
jgi:uncharacterized cupin superfamily protein